MGKFLYKIEKEEKEDHIELSLFYVDNKQETIIEKKQIPYTILAKKKDFDSLKVKTDKIVLSKKNFKNKNEEKVVEIQISSKELHEYILGLFRDAKCEIYEADLISEHKYIIDNNIKLSEFTGKPKLKYVSIDIESIGPDIKEQEIIMISSYNPFESKFNKVYFSKDKLPVNKLKEVKKGKYEGFECEILENEKELLEKFKSDIIGFSPQIIFGWNVIDFDFKVIKDRMTIHGIEFKFSNYNGDCKLRIVNDFFRDSTMNCPGLIVYDLIQLLKTNFISFEDYKLNTVAKEVLGDEKIDLTEDESDADSIQNKCQAIEDMFVSNPSKLVNYNFKDSLLTAQIAEKLGLLDLMNERSIITGTPLMKVKSPIAALDIMYLKKLHERGYVASSNFNYDATAPIEGAYVIDPEKGFYEDVFVFDFKSLYPSIIMTFNIDPFTVDLGEEIKAPNGAKFTSKPGILPELILKLYKERDSAKKIKDEFKSYALKITMNSFYGAMASPKSRFHNRDVGGAITAFGRKIIQMSKEFAESLGHKVVYGDTDSVFVKIAGLEGKSLNEKKSVGISLEKQFNDYFESWVEKEFGQKSFLTIEMEKIFSKFFIASKKRYVGFDEISSKTKFVGMEAIRGDWTELAKDFQIDLIELIFKETKKEKIENFIKDRVARLRKGEFNSKLVYTKKITKPLSHYTKTTPPHVKAAREVQNFEGRIVKYVQLKDGPKHISLLVNPNYDYEHYIEKQLKGVSDDILECFGVNFEEIVGSTKQKSLSGFFG